MGKLLLITDYAPPYIGGMESHAHEYAKALSRKGGYTVESVFLLASNAPDASAHFLKNSGIAAPVHVLTESSTINDEELLLQLHPFAPGADTVLFFNSIHWTKVLPAVRNAFPDARIVLRSGGNDIVQAPLKGTGETLADRQRFIVETLKHSLDALIVNSEYSKERMVALGMPRHLMHVVRGGVDVDRFAPVSQGVKEELRIRLGLPLNAIIALAACRLESFKGLAWALEVIAMTQPKDFLYVIVGDGPLCDELRHIADSLGISALVRFCRGVTHDRIHEYFRTADLYCHFPEEFVRTVSNGSYVHTETMGRSFCEAMASGLPVLATSVGGVSEIVTHNTHGILISPRDLETAHNSLLKLVENPALRKIMGDSGRDTATAQFAWEVVRTKYEDIFSL